MDRDSACSCTPTRRRSQRNLFVFGNYNAGSGNDSIVFKKSGKNGSWVEWNNGFAAGIRTGVTLTLVSYVCAAPALAADNAAVGDPMQ